MINWILIIELYVLMLVGALIHELSHFGRKIHIDVIPWKSWSLGPGLEGFWAMIPELIIFGAIAYYNSTQVLIQYLGFILFLHFTLSTITGYFGKSIYNNTGPNDNKGNILAFIVGIAVLIYFWTYYSHIAINIFHGVLGI